MEIKGTGTYPAKTLDEVGLRNINSTKESDQAQGSDPASRTQDDKHSYSVSVSDRARQMEIARKKAFDIAKKTSPVREDKVADLKARIKDGTYQVDPGNIAEGMLREAVKDELSVAE